MHRLAGGQLGELPALSRAQLGRTPVLQLVEAPLRLEVIGTIQDPAQAAGELAAEQVRIGQLRLAVCERLDPVEPLVRSIMLDQSAGPQIRARVQGFNQVGEKIRVRDVHGADPLDAGGLRRERRLVEQHPHRARRGGFRAPEALGVGPHPVAEPGELPGRAVPRQRVEPCFDLAPVRTGRNPRRIQRADPHHELMPVRAGRDPSDVGAETIDETCATLRRARIHPGGEVVEQEPAQGQRTVEPALERLPAFRPHEAVGVLALGEEQERRLPAGLHGGERVLHRAPGRAPARLVAVEAEHDVVDGAEQPLDVDLGRGGAEGRHRVADARLRERHHVHVALHHEQPLRRSPRAPRAPQPVELAALAEHRGLRGVEVLRLAAVDDAGAESGDAPLRVVDGEGDPVAEAVVGPAAVALDEQARPDERCPRGPPGAERAEHPVPSGRREAELELGRDLPRQAAPLEVVHRPRRFRVAAELAPEPGVRLFEHVEERLEVLARPAPAAVFAAFPGHLASDPARELLHRLHELHVRVVHQEADRRAVRPAAEAVVELLVGDDGERRGLLVVERAARLELLAGALQGDVVLDDFDDVDAGDEVVDEGLGDPSCHVPAPPPRDPAGHGPEGRYRGAAPEVPPDGEPPDGSPGRGFSPTIWP